MSDLRKWLKIVESVHPIIAGESPRCDIDRDSTVVVSANKGGGVGRFMKFTENGSALIDIKGVVRELSKDDFTVPNRNLETGNDWFHMSVSPDTAGTQADKPEFRPGDMVKIADVYGAVIGPGYGVFIGYGTTGEDCILLFDGKQIVVPVENVASVLEQDAKDNFDDMDNDGNLSPMSFGSENIKVKQEPEMDHRDEFSKWMGTVEEAMGYEEMIMAEPGSEMKMGQQPGNCACGSWDCPSCFPDMNAEVITCPHCGHTHTDEPECATGGMELRDSSTGGMGAGAVAYAAPMEEEDGGESQVASSQAGRNGGHKLGDIVQKFVAADDSESPLTHGDDNLKEMIPADADPADYGKAGRYIDKHVFGDDEVEEGWYDPQPSEFGSMEEPDYDADPLAVRDARDEMEQIDPEHRLDMISVIMSADMNGLSNAQQPYSEAELGDMNAPKLKKTYKEVTGKDFTSQGQPTMENVDKDVAAMMNSLKKYDALRESVAPVIGMTSLGEKKGSKPDFFHNKDKKSDEQLKAPPKEVKIKEKADKPDFLDLDKDGDKEESMKKAAKDAEKVEESADQEVLNWMARFSKLGNMKGYGR
jgi:hypothetical protein